MKSPFSDEQLVTLYIDTQHSIYFAQLYQRHFAKIARKCLKITQNSALAQDITQDIFLKLFHKLASFRGQAHFSAWLNSIIYHACLDELRQQKIRHEVSLYDNQAQSELLGAEDVVDLTELYVQQLDQAYQRLSSGEQSLLQLKYRDELSIGDMAELHGVSESAIKMRLKRSRDRLRQIYRLID